MKKTQVVSKNLSKLKSEHVFRQLQANKCHMSLKQAAKMSLRRYVIAKNIFANLFSDFEAYHEQMGPIPSSNGSLDIALSNAQSWSPR